MAPAPIVDPEPISDAAPPVHLAVDLGASSGRVIAGVVQEGRLVLEPIHRFENEVVRVQQSLQWDLLGLWREIQIGLREAAARYGQIKYTNL